MLFVDARGKIWQRSRMKLTNPMRQFLGQAQPGPYLYDVVRAFRAEFGLDVETAARLVAQWIRETQ